MQLAFAQLNYVLRKTKSLCFRKFSNFNWKHTRHLKLNEEKLVWGNKDTPANTIDSINYLL